MAKRRLNRIAIEVAQCPGVGIEELIRMPDKKEGGE